MKNKVLFIGNIVAILSCLSFSACSNQAPAEKDIAEKTSSVAEIMQSGVEEITASDEKPDVSDYTDTEETSSSETDSEKNPLEEYAYKIEYDQRGIKRIYIGVERVSDNEVKTKDGRLSRKFEYAVNEETNSIDFTVTSTNHSDEDIVIEKRAWIVVRTDFTDPDINFSQTSDFQGVRIKPGESVEYNTSWELEDGWSTADVEMGLYVQVDEEGVWYGGEPDGDSMDFDFTVTA